MDTLVNIVKQFRLVNYWFLSATESIKDDDGSRVVDGQSNSMEWIAGHLITGRYRNLVRLGVDVDPYKYLNQFVNQTIPPPNAIAFDKNIRYPPLSESREQWTNYA